MEDKLLEVSVVAKMLNVSADTVRRMMKDPENPLTGTRISKRCYRVHKSSVDAVIKARMVC